ncbi:hypothetical protein Riv7116_1855 [Rivularia sp. PCC 7116]|uniref:hypothetical protein n=1 Tax=Rivularia sp. PCC 7116 TaxID=373994 RepID=UPI00029F3330|nr:hypothetical protein [Rivularia sp. PCC 7116]AFY54396.1 hypothetical protein Riv7116_1855 [Rivularia sp. PCC 7116]
MVESISRWLEETGKQLKQCATLTWDTLILILENYDYAFGYPRGRIICLIIVAIELNAIFIVLNHWL